MRIIKWNPYRNLVSLPVELDRLFEKFGHDYWNTDTVWNPAVDVIENDNGYEFKAEIPGMNKNDIKISFEDDMLTVSGERKFEKDENKKNYQRVERSYGKFQRSFRIPGVNGDEIKANYKDGILTIDMPKSEQAKPKEIAIK